MIKEGLLGTIAIAEFGGIVFGCISTRSTTWSLLILFGGLAVMLWTILLGSTIITRTGERS